MNLKLRANFASRFIANFIDYGVKYDSKRYLKMIKLSHYIRMWEIERQRYFLCKSFLGFDLKSTLLLSRSQ